jgi:glutathione S-transferase
MRQPYTLHGWQLSYFSGKTRGYLNFKGLPFEDNNVNAYDLMVRIPKKTGVMVMPAIQTDQGEWLQDSTMIMEELDKRHPESSVMPETPKQIITSMLLEAWFDEYWIPIGMHYRWSYPENYDLFIHDASKGLLPFVPNFIRRPLAVKIAKGLQDFLPTAGVRPEQFAMMERRTNEILDLLEIHFNQYDYLLGDKPSIADFSLLGPMYGHLNRDPAPKRDLLDVRPRLQNWVERCHAGEGKKGSYLVNDEIPETLIPILKVIGLEFIPMVKNIVKNTEQFVKDENKKSGQGLPRAIGDTTFAMHGGMFSRGALPYTVWMMQRIQDCLNGLSNEDKQTVNGFTALFMDESIGELNLGPKLVRKAVTTRLA